MLAEQAVDRWSLSFFLRGQRDGPAVAGAG
jgi:hypothetical protein